MFGTPDQKERWLQPLLDGQIRSAFAMTEPDVASSDATNISTTIVRDGDEYVINGRKWWITGAMNPNCRVFVVMGKTDPEAGIGMYAVIRSLRFADGPDEVHKNTLARSELLRQSRTEAPIRIED